MAWDNNKRSMFSVNYNTAFIEDKAYSLGILSNGKFKIAIISKIAGEWDFKNQTAIYVDQGYLSRIIMACNEMIRIAYHKYVLNDLSINHPTYNTSRIRIPLVAYTNNTEYGEFIVGITKGATEADARRFFIQYSYMDKESNNRIEDFVVFKNDGKEGRLEYVDESGVRLCTQTTTYSLYLNFVSSLRMLHIDGPAQLAMINAFIYNKIGGGGGSITKGGKGPASLPVPSGPSETNISNPDEDDIPF